MSGGTRPSVTVVDYGMGNLFSVSRALERSGAEVRQATTAGEIDGADRLVLPGVGAFADGMRELAERGLVEPLRRYAASGRPFLGICLGMQMMFETSEEFGEWEGLGLLRGRVAAVPGTSVGGLPHKVPHVGWSGLHVPHAGDWSESILGSLGPGSAVYFVHSFAAQPAHRADLLAEVEYGGRRLCAAVRRGPLNGCQFHPEKSAEVGLGIMREFVMAGGEAAVSHRP
jgi:glutamine amidotransferase